MISVSGKEWKERKIPKRLIDKISNDFDISKNLSKFYLARSFNKEDILIKNLHDHNLNIFSRIINSLKYKFIKLRVFGRSLIFK